MTTQVRSAGWGYRLGRTARRVLRRYRAGEQRAIGWLAAKDLSTELAWAAVWGARLGIAAVLLYVSFWIAALIAFAIAVAWVADESSSSEDDVWPFMTWQERRSTTGYDPVPYEDIEHPDYPDDKNA